MTEEKIIDTNKQPDKPQEKLTDERLSDNELEKIAGGTGEGDTSEIAYFDEPLPPQIFVGGK